MNTIVFTGGGTAGHVMPSLPLMAAFADRGWSVAYIGSKSGPEAELVQSRGHPFHTIAAGKLRRYVSLENLVDVFRVAKGIAQAWRLLGRLAPAVVFSKGGFVSFPVVLAARLRRIPVVAHESDLTPGLANRMSLPFVTALCTTFALTNVTDRAKAIVHTGTPLRADLIAGDADRGRAYLGATANQSVLVVVGGSLGAEAINRVVRDALPALTGWFVAHVCGPGRRIEAADVAGVYRQLEFVGAEWGDVLAAADVVVSRAGANTLYELVALRKPHVLVPLSRRASRGDQIENAAYAEANGWSKVIQEEALTAEALVEAVVQVVANADTWRQRMATAGFGDGTSALLEVIARYARVGVNTSVK